MIIQINVGTGWDDISQYVEKGSILRNLKLHKNLSPTINTMKFKVIKNSALINTIIAATVVYVRAFEDDGITYYFDGKVNNNFKVKVKTSVDGLSLECVDLSWTMKDELTESLSYEGYKLMDGTDETHSLVHLLLEKTDFPLANISGQEFTQTVPYFNAEIGETVEDILGDLLGEYGYIYNIEIDGTFQIYPFVEDSIPAANSLDNTNLLGSLTIKKNEAQAKTVTVNYRPILEEESRILSSDTSGGSRTYKANIQVSPGGYYPQDSESSDISMEYKYDDKEIYKVDNVSLDMEGQDDLSTYKFTPEETGAIISIENENGVYPRYIHKLDIIGDVYYYGDYNAEYVHNGEATEKTENIEAKYITEKAAAALLAQIRANFWKYADHSYSGTSKDEFSLGSFISLSDTTLGLSTVCQITEVKDKNDGYYDYTLIGAGAYEALAMTGEINIHTVAPPVQQPQVDNILQEISEGFDLVLEGETIGTKTPEAPTLVVNMDKRNAHLLCSIQANLTAPCYWEFQVSEDEVNWYGLSMDGVDWKESTLMGTTRSDLPAIVHSHIPNIITGGVVSGRPLKWRCRVHLLDGTLSPFVSSWSNTVSGTTFPIVYEDISTDAVGEDHIQADSVSEDIIQDGAVSAGKISTGVLETLIANIRSYVTISEAGFEGTTYSQIGEHTFTTADRRAYLDQDELTFQAVASVANNVPTWGDTIKIGGSDKSIKLYGAGAYIELPSYGKIGYKIGDAGNEFSIAPFTGGLTSTRVTLPATSGMSLMADHMVAFEETDGKNVIGFMDLNAATFNWGGDIKAYGSYYYGDDKAIIKYDDSWLRLNPSKHFTSGIYCYGVPFRSDGGLQVGTNGASFLADTSKVKLGVNLEAKTIIYLEDKKHAITASDGGGNFNIRVGNSPESTPKFTETGYASHWCYDQSTGTWDFKSSTLSGDVDEPVDWKSVLTISPVWVTFKTGVTLEKIYISSPSSIKPDRSYTIIDTDRYYFKDEYDQDDFHSLYFLYEFIGSTPQDIYVYNFYYDEDYDGKRICFKNNSTVNITIHNSRADGSRQGNHPSFNFGPGAYVELGLNGRDIYILSDNNPGMMINRTRLDYTGAPQQFTVPKSGPVIIKMCGGAGGGGGGGQTDSGGTGSPGSSGGAAYETMLHGFLYAGKYTAYVGGGGGGGVNGDSNQAGGAGGWGYANGAAGGTGSTSGADGGGGGGGGGSSAIVGANVLEVAFGGGGGGGGQGGGRDGNGGSGGHGGATDPAYQAAGGLGGTDSRWDTPGDPSDITFRESAGDLTNKNIAGGTLGGAESNGSSGENGYIEIIYGGTNFL